jgi:signal transduction histidine kinase
VVLPELWSAAPAPMFDGGGLISAGDTGGSTDPVARRRVLLVDDNTDDADRVRQLLAAHPTAWDVVHVRRAADVTEHVGVDVTIADLGPDSDDVQRVRALSSKLGDVPLVVLAQHGRDAVGTRVLAAGAHDVILKRDLSLELLDRTLCHAIERAKWLARIRSVVANNSDAILVVDDDGEVLFLNPAAERLFERAGGGIGWRFPHPVAEASVIELPSASKDGEARAAEMRVSSVEWYGQSAHVVSLRDITDRRRAEDLQERLWHADRLAAVGQLAAGVAHEINNPASFVLGNFRLIEEEFVGLEEHVRRAAAPDGAILSRITQTRVMLEDCHDGVQRIAKLVKDLRVFARTEGEDSGPVDVNDLVRTSCNMTFNEVRHRAQLVMHLGIVPHIVGDGAKLVQVLTNLLLNAAHAIEPGHASSNRVTVATMAEDNHVKIAVEDTGSGISDENRTKIFEPFFTTKPREVGTGLGLSLSGDIVRRHGGEITFTSIPGKGTAFEVTLPVEPISMPAPRLPPPARAATTSARVLVIDDELALLRVYTRLLRKRHTVVAATSGREAVDLVRGGAAFDAILCDIMMPEMDGIEVYEALGAIDPSLPARIIFCSGGVFTQQAKAFIKTIPNILLEKPFDPDLLLRVIDQVCAGPPSTR